MLGSEINSEEKMGEEINRRIQNSSEFYQTIKGTLWKRDNLR
jgi:hypothetical protein